MSLSARLAKLEREVKPSGPRRVIIYTLGGPPVSVHGNIVTINAGVDSYWIQDPGDDLSLDERGAVMNRTVMDALTDEQRRWIRPGDEVVIFCIPDESIAEKFQPEHSS